MDKQIFIRFADDFTDEEMDKIDDFIGYIQKGYSLRELGYYYQWVDIRKDGKMKGKVCIQKIWSKHYSKKSFPALVVIRQEKYGKELAIMINTNWLNPYAKFQFPYLESISYNSMEFFASYKGRMYRILFYPDLKE